MKKKFTLSNESKSRIIWILLPAVFFAIGSQYTESLLYNFILLLLVIIIMICIFRLIIDSFLIRHKYILYYRFIFERKIYYDDILSVSDNYDDDFKIHKKRVLITKNNNKSYKIRIHKYEFYSELLTILRDLNKSKK